MQLSIRVMIRFLASSWISAILFLVMAGYLVQGKVFTGSLDPGIMLTFSSALIVQSLWAMLHRLMVLSGKVSEHLKPKKGLSLTVSTGNARSLLEKRSFSETSGGNGGVLCFVKGRSLSIVLAVLAYGSLIFMLLSGSINYGFGVSGEFELSPGGEWIDMSRVELERGFLVDTSEPTLRIRALQLEHVTSDRPSSITFEAGNNGKSDSHRLEQGQSVKIDRFKIRFLGDYYVAMMTTRKGTHDYMPRPLTLRRDRDSTDGIYRGNLFLGEPDTRGNGEFDPSSGIFRITVYRDENVEFDGDFSYGEKAKKGDFVAGVTALMHAGRFEISRYGFRNQVIMGMGGFAVFLILRMVFRPKSVYIWREGEKTFFSTTNRSTRKMLVKAQPKI